MEQLKQENRKLLKQVEDLKAIINNLKYYECKYCHDYFNTDNIIECRCCKENICIDCTKQKCIRCTQCDDYIEYLCLHKQKDYIKYGSYYCNICSKYICTLCILRRACDKCHDGYLFQVKDIQIICLYCDDNFDCIKCKGIKCLYNGKDDTKI